ncbi:protein phosphatase CheZ, partial [Azospirillum sp.]|uniref:protein phosphatase CheZ n=1 Tax=Azospirillum sp. TaxID=34012 RepID=UPI002D607425
MEALPQLTEDEFDQIEEAIARTAKGRAFLRRCHRRAMGAATEEVRSMLQEFRSSWQHQSESAEAAQRVDVLRRELMEMAASIEQARREVAALRPPDGASDKILSATNELDAIVISTERASFEILNAAEKLMELSGRLRADGANGALCGEIESEVTNIFTACSFQDLTGQRTSKVVNALRYIEQRINAMIGIWGVENLAGLTVHHESTDTRPDAHLLNGPQLHGQGVSQADVDSMFDSLHAAPTPAPAPEPAPAPVAAKPTGEKQSQADIDSLFDSPAPPPAPAAPAKQSQADIDALFDSPAPAPAAAPAKQSQADIDALFDSPAPAPAPAKQ